jgi:hypothetical protein
MTAPLLLAMGLVATGLLGVIGLEIASFGRPEVPELAAPRRLPVPAQARSPGGERPTQDLVDRALSRPLFNADRRPAPDAATGAGQPARPEPPRLAGILLTAQGRQAIFATGERSIVVSEGGSIAGFVVTSISGEEVSVTGPGGTRVLRPSFVPSGGETSASGRPAAGTEAAFRANPAPTGLDILRNATRQAGLPSVGGTPPAPVPRPEPPNDPTAPAPARSQGFQAR